MQDLEIQRLKMVDNQLRPNDITNLDLLSAFLKIEREQFVPRAKSEFAYIDEDIELIDDRYLMEPASFGKLLQACNIKTDELVMVIGCGSGYSTAIIAQLASFVVGLESDDNLFNLANETIEAQEITNVSIIQGELSEGHAEHAPYDVILLEGAIEATPDKLLEQLKDGGRLACVVGTGNAAQATMFKKADGLISKRVLFNSAVKPLPGFQKTVEFAL